MISHDSLDVERSKNITKTVSSTLKVQEIILVGNETDSDVVNSEASTLTSAIPQEKVGKQIESSEPLNTKNSETEDMNEENLAEGSKDPTRNEDTSSKPNAPKNSKLNRINNFYQGIAEKTK